MDNVRPAVLMLLALCFLVAPGLEARPPKVEMEIPFHRPGLGIGRGALLASVQLPSGDELELLSRYVVTGLQTLGHSLEGEGVDLFRLPEKSWIETDIVPLERALVDLYNEATGGDLALPNDRAYGLSYRFMYEVESKEIVFVMRCQLHARGVRSNRWRKHRGEYASQFFVDRFKESIHYADHAARGLGDDEGESEEVEDAEEVEAAEGAS